MGGKGLGGRGGNPLLEQGRGWMGFIEMDGREECCFGCGGWRGIGGWICVWGLGGVRVDGGAESEKGGGET